jgi:hypothetical protein
MIQVSFRSRESLRLPSLSGLLLGLAVAGACFAVAGLAEAGTNARIALVSQQYHARAGTTEPGRSTTAHRWTSNGFPRYHALVFQYQFHFEISNANETVSRSSLQRKWNQILSLTTRRGISDPSWTGTSTPVQNSESADERGLLLRLGLAFALLYVVFLICWFWGTREGRRRFEGAARF